MKKLLFTLAILPLLAFVSCSSNDDDTPTIPKESFDHDIELLYGQWRATSVEGVADEAIDLTNPLIEAMIPATYITFGEDRSFASEGIIGNHTGVYTTSKKTIVAATGKDNENKITFDIPMLTAETARVEIDPSILNLDIIPEELEMVTVVLTKQGKDEVEKN